MSKDRTWSVFVVSDDIAENNTASYLVVTALNRYKAREALCKMLALEPDWLKPDGTLRPFRIDMMRQATPSQIKHDYAMYVGAFSDFADDHEGSTIKTLTV